ncbi:MAG: ribulose-phosphate 3-epimerase [Verrucomicrobia bacterium]|nr:MAG: ribulose-phosphate 3-epimerase [Verrucomicrobiota bacterium]
MQGQKKGKHRNYAMQQEGGIKIYPSVLAADMGRLKEMAQAAAAAGADGLHLDIMDGYFVNNISMGFDLISDLRSVTNLPISVHLMVMWPEWYIPRCAEKGADTILFHVEARSEIETALRVARRMGSRVGLVLNPETPAESAVPHLGLCDEILCMSVHPGFGGQVFIESVLYKIRLIRKEFPQGIVSVDGGLDADTSAKAVECGADLLYLGTYLFKAQNMAATIANLRKQCRRADA